jgi:predicted O-methyltransferase YrrM
MIDALYDQRCQQPSDMHELLPVLRYFASLCESVTEFGVRGGNSTVALLAGRPKVVISVDIAPGDPAFGEVQAAIPKETKFFFIVGDALEIDIKPTDLLFIDTDHTTEQLQSELARHAGKVGRYILMHDTEIFGAQLNPPIDEFLSAHPEWREILRLRNCNGLRVLERGAA